MRCKRRPYLPARLAFLPAARHHVIHLTRRLDFFADSSGEPVGPRMDVLSTVLRALKLEGAVFYIA